MWKVYREEAEVLQNGFAVCVGAEVWRYWDKQNADYTFSEEVANFLDRGFRVTPEVYLEDLEGVEKFVALEDDEGNLALVVLFREEEEEN